jgi:hypothetical protein
MNRNRAIGYLNQARGGPVRRLAERKLISCSMQSNKKSCVPIAIGIAGALFFWFVFFWARRRP